MIEETNTSDSSSAEFDRSKATVVLETTLSSGRIGTIETEMDVPAMAHKEVDSTTGTVTNVASKIFRARVNEALMLISEATEEWDSGSGTWLNSIHRARDALNELIRFDEY